MQRFEANGTVITWVVFKGAFLEKYFTADVRGRKEVEFLELKQGNMIVADYAAKFEELSRFCPYYNGAEAEMSKCIKFESGLRPEIKQFIRYQEIHQFSVLSVSDKRNGNLNQGKPYGDPSIKRKHRSDDEKNPSGGGASNFVRCYKCGEFGHRISDYKSTTANCFKCGKPGHRATDCRSNVVTCYNYGEQGHISTNCQKPKKN
ncbi:uncharacterized protein LOC127121639 [Lathyrus oleraceus]|uniref:uncharacterized protein LOC127121639 n=1 Tax=Pisum sativum TaxID=3888 RepID=UPI0021D185B3|nr:uncharacterized protein LOC127121639 [Pisum sativum]